MPQVLKEEYRNAIIIAAKKEFLEKGYKNASMRSIASKANMTVGNLYRYFKSKEEINLYIVSNTFKLIDNSLKTITKDPVSLEARVFDVQPNKNELSKVFDRLADSLVDVYMKHKVEFVILIMHSRLDEELVQWFNNIFRSFIFEDLIDNNLEDKKEILINAYSHSMFAGIQSIFKTNENDDLKLRKLLKSYLKSYIKILNDDISEFKE